MNPDVLIAHYDRISEAPDAIPRLRQFILDLAVRGKLVEQDPNDEPAQNGFDSIQPERLSWDESKNLLSPTSQESRKARVPNGWFRAKFAELYILEYGDNLPAEKRSNTGEFPVYGSNGVVGTHNECYVNEPCIVIGRKGSAGALNLSLSKGCCVTDVAYYCCPPKGVDIEYSFRLFQTLGFDKLGKGIKPGLSRKDVYNLYVTIPPKAEQQRIVAKVDELMALCDRLEETRKEREKTRNQLVAGCFQRLSQPDEDEEVFREDARFTLNHLSRMTTRPAHIKQLRQTILNLAVRGKLVEQDPNDEPASELLEQIREAKAFLKRETGDARIRIESDPNPEDFGLGLPQGWSVQSFQNLFLFVDYRGNTPPKTSSGVPLITAKNIRMGSLNREPREFISPSTFGGWMTRGLPKLGDIFFTTEAPLANVCLNNIEEPFALAQRVICLQPYAKIDTRYLMFALMSNFMQGLINSHATGMTAKGIKASNLKPLPIPIPPFAEQHRIVARVDELMALCDQLEKQLTAVDSDSRRLLEAVLQETLDVAV